MSYSILIVDDSSVTRRVVRRSLEMAGLPLGEVIEAGNGIEALALLGKSWVDVVFADLNMPEMGGVELVRRMTKDPVLADIPVGVISSDRNAARRRELMRLGIRAYVSKPFRPEGLRDVVVDLLERGRKAS